MNAPSTEKMLARRCNRLVQQFLTNGAFPVFCVHRDMISNALQLIMRLPVAATRQCRKKNSVLVSFISRDCLAIQKS